jgi:hypothetical protein
MKIPSFVIIALKTSPEFARGVVGTGDSGRREDGADTYVADVSRDSVNHRRDAPSRLWPGSRHIATRVKDHQFSFVPNGMICALVVMVLQVGGLSDEAG